MNKRQATFVKGLGAIVMVLGLTQCGGREKPNFIYMPDMVYSPAFKAQEKGGMRTPPEHSIPRGFTPYPYRGLPETAGEKLRNPYQNERAVLMRGKVLYQRFCYPCHGVRGEGMGPVTPKYPMPPSLHSTKVRNWTDGRIFHTITMGQNLMPSYASQILPEQRWKIVKYVRVLQRANNPTAADIKALEKW